jgi:dipeptidyl aminopeptidase/acylaminoacyl peptidase
MAHTIRIALLGLALSATWPSVARPYTVDDLLSSEKFGNVLVSRDGRWLVFERWVATTQAAGFHFNSMEVQRSRLYRVDLARPGSAEPLLPIEPKVATAAYAFSPDGRYLAFGQLKGRAWRLGIATMATGAIRWFDLAPDYNVFRPTLAWVSDSRLVTLASPGGALPWMLDLDTKAQRIFSRAWQDQQAGDRPTVMAVGSGREISITPDHPPVSLVEVDAQDGTTRELARGPFGALSVSVDGQYAAVLEERELIAPRADQLLAGGTDQRRRRLNVVALRSGEVWHPCPACDLTVAPPAWSTSGHRLVYFARDGGTDWSNGKVRLVDAGRRTSRVLALGSLSPDLGDYPMNPATISVAWQGSAPLLLARRHPDDPRADWYRLDTRRPVVLTSALADPGPSLVRTSDGGLLVTSGPDVWAIGPNGARHLGRDAALAQGIAPVAANRVASDTQLVSLASEGAAIVVRAWGEGGGSIVATVPGSGAIRPYAVVGKDRMLIAGETEIGGMERLFVREGPLAPVVVADLNRELADVDTARPIALHYRLADGTRQTSWLYVPPHPAGSRLPLIVMPYGGSVYGDTPPSRDGRGFELGTSNLAVVTGHGYAVLLPSMPELTQAPRGPVDYAGQILPAVDAAIGTGLVDAHRLGLWGHSFGAYNSAMALTETDRFAAALLANGMYDFAGGIGVFSPWTRVDPGNGQSILALAGLSETGRPNLRATPWGDPEVHVANSAIFRADRIDTPLLIVGSDQDSVSLGQSESLFSALFRQGKDAELLSYWGENHVLMSPANIRDFYARAFRWFDEQFSRVTPSPPSAGEPEDCAAGSDPTRPAPSARPAARAAARHNGRCA